MRILTNENTMSITFMNRQPHRPITGLRISTHRPTNFKLNPRSNPTFHEAKNLCFIVVILSIIDFLSSKPWPRHEYDFLQIINAVRIPNFIFSSLHIRINWSLSLRLCHFVNISGCEWLKCRVFNSLLNKIFFSSSTGQRVRLFPLV